MNFRVALVWLFMVYAPAFAQSGPRSRALGVPFDGNPGPLDAITDVKGVEVGDTTLIRGKGKLVVGQGPVHWCDRGLPPWPRRCRTGLRGMVLAKRKW
jgi:hypothetical protein